MSGPVAESKKIANKLQEIEDETRLGIHHKTRAGEYLPPAQYFERDKEDDYIQAKKEVTAKVQAAGADAFGTEVLVTEDDIKYLMSQKTKEELNIYDQWCYETFNPGADPNKLELFRQLNPGWFERREKEIRKQIQMALKLAKFGLRGPRTEDELFLMYALDQGIAQPPDLDLLFPEKAKVKQAAIARLDAQRIQQGYWNPRKYTIQRDVRSRNLSQAVQPFIVNPIGGQAGVNPNLIRPAGQAPNSPFAPFFAQR